jgi:UDP-N-acetylmuramoylalanine-D-glutamate ligase
MTTALSTTRRPPLPRPPYLVVGLGRAGEAAARALGSLDERPPVRAWDGVRDSIQLERAEGLRRIGVDVHLGGDGLDALAGVGTVVKSPGVPPEIPVLAEAARRRLPIVDELEIGWLLVPSPTVAVTGTNGKSTVAGLLVSVLAEHGLEPALAGNTEFGPPLSGLALGPRPRSVVAEVSSYQAEYSPEMVVDGAVFTNLTPEHLNRHGTMEGYEAAKRALFVKDTAAVPLTAVNVDDPAGRRLAHGVEEGGGRALRYGESGDADYRILGSRWDLHGGEIEIESPSGRAGFSIGLPGAHNAFNAVGALALAEGLGLPREPTLTALRSAKSAPGRFELVEVDRPFDVVVDFAYGPDSVRAFLDAARAIVEPGGGRLIAVVAIVGRAGPRTGRDVGRIARERCDHLILSGTSYRGEPRIVTLAALASGARTTDGAILEIVIDRRAAIARAMALASAGDLVVLLGRGATAREATDLRGGFSRLDDRAVARELARSDPLGNLASVFGKRAIG